jgi:hypothetical protein
MPLTARQSELTARHLLAHPEQIPVYLKHRKWAELAALVNFTTRDTSLGLAHTDPALYRLLRQQITEYHLRGWTCLNFQALQKLAQGQSGRRTKAPRQPEHHR